LVDAAALEQETRGQEVDRAGVRVQLPKLAEQPRGLRGVASVQVLRDPAQLIMIERAS
jgi:hypothetical protein